ncbi:MAG: hypothetical protein GF405_08355 [Candidatus Eisenbacteria bacterium]|nr:hypothetical protein [Candidatus Eisenbacteria bacterium]
MPQPCDRCGKAPAAVHYAEVVDGRLSVWALCETCAHERGVATTLPSFAGPLVGILMGLLEDDSLEETPPDAACDECGMSYADFRRTGRLGCGACYDRFSSELAPLLRRIHGSTQHLGRMPSGFEAQSVRREELRRLKADLRRAVFREEYERAAELRDAIRSIERASGEEGDGSSQA